MADSRTPGSNTQANIAAKLLLERSGQLGEDRAEVLAQMDRVIAGSRAVEDNPAPGSSETNRELTAAIARRAPAEIIQSLRDKLSAAEAREGRADPDRVFQEFQVLSAQPAPAALDERRRRAAQLRDLSIKYQTAAKIALDQELLKRRNPVLAYQTWREAVVSQRSPLMTQGLLDVFRRQADEPIDATFLARVAEDAFRTGKFDLVQKVYGPDAAGAIQIEIASAQGAKRNSADRQRQLDALKARGAPAALANALQSQLDAQLQAEGALAGKIAPPAPAATPAPAPRPAADAPIPPPILAPPPAPAREAAIEAKPSVLRELAITGALLSPAIVAFLATHRSD